MKRYYYILFVLTAWACNNIEDAEPAGKRSFIRFYEGVAGQEGVMALPDGNGGYIVAGNIQHDNNVTSDILIIKCDNSANVEWESIIKNSIVRSIHITTDGYLIAGDSIEYDPASSVISEIENTHARLVKLDLNGNITMEYVKSDILFTGSDSLHVDFHGSGINVTEDGSIYYLGSFKSPLASSYERSFIAVLNPSFEVLWSQNYLLQDRDYLNCRSIHILDNKAILWATTSYKSSQNLASAYVSIVYTAPNSTFENNDLFGENDTRNHIAFDINSSGATYGVVGTYAENNGANANVYFLRVDNRGQVISGSERYFDGGNPDGIVLSADNRDASASQDAGNAITGTSDGGFAIAGSMQSIPGKGNGGQDILLIKLDAFGNLVWERLIGGSGDEIASSIHETPDGGLLICGTNTVNGLASIFMMKTDKNGELKN